MGFVRNRQVRAHGHRPCAAALMLLAVLAGCDSLPGTGAASEGAETSTPRAAALAATDVEAPEVFQTAETGLWDGRPSLGGVWVAHPDATDPERVLVVNADNGQQIVGALFRRERDLPGPALQVSSDAAEALGMLAGAPAELRVTALRREEAPAEEPAPDAPGIAAGEPAAAAAESPETLAAATEAVLAGTAGPAEPAPPAAPRASEPAGDLSQATAAILAGAPAAASGAAAPGVATTSLDGTAAASALTYPFVQLATSRSEADARAAAGRLAAQGLPARVIPQGSAFRLLLGPATTEAEQEALQSRAVAAGYADAYLVRS